MFFRFGNIFVGKKYDCDDINLVVSPPEIGDDCNLDILENISQDFQHKMSIAIGDFIKLYKQLKNFYHLENWKKKVYPLVIEYCPEKYLEDVHKSRSFYFHHYSDLNERLQEGNKDECLLLEDGLFNRKVYGVPSYSALEKFWNSQEFLRMKEFSLDKNYIEQLDFLETVQDNWEKEKEEKSWIS